MSTERELLRRAYEVIRRGEIRLDSDCSGESPLAKEIKAALAVREESQTCVCNAKCWRVGGETACLYVSDDSWMAAMAARATVLAVAAREEPRPTKGEEPGSSYWNPIHVSNEELSRRMAATRHTQTTGAERWAGAIVTIAYCPEHGLHGFRDDCSECGKPVEQVLARVLSARVDTERPEATEYREPPAGTSTRVHEQRRRVGPWEDLDATGKVSVRDTEQEHEG